MNVPAQVVGQVTAGQDKRKEKKKIPAAFAKYKFYLDVKVSKLKNLLIEDITALGGNLVEFLTKEVTHVISEGPEWKFAVLSSAKCGPPSPWTPGANTPSPATPSSVDGDKKLKVRTRVENIVGIGKPDYQTGADVIETAKRFRCQIWALNKTLAWLEKFKAKYGRLSSSGSSVSSSRQHSLPRPQHQILVDPFIKLDSNLRQARPSFLEFKSWPKINVDGYAGTSPFSDQKKLLKRKKVVSRLESLRNKENYRKKESAKRKVSGFCEICNVNFSEIESHLQGETHTTFVKDSSNWKELDANSQSQLLHPASNLLF